MSYTSVIKNYLMVMIDESRFALFLLLLQMTHRLIFIQAQNYLSNDLIVFPSEKMF